MNVTLQPGDTTAKLSQDYTGSEAAADDIALFNGLVGDDGYSPFYKYAPLPVEALGFMLEIPDGLITTAQPSPVTMFGLSGKQFAGLAIAGIILLLLGTGSHR